MAGIFEGFAYVSFSGNQLSCYFIYYFQNFAENGILWFDIRAYGVIGS
jgi:hypothetical protein